MAKAPRSAEDFRAALKENDEDRLAAGKELEAARQKLRDLTHEHYELNEQLQEALVAEAEAAGDEEGEHRDGKAPGVTLTASARSNPRR